MPNGWKNEYGQKPHRHHHKHHHKDVAERNMDEEVHGFTAEYTPGTPNARSDQAYQPNGNKNVYPTTSSLHQHKHHKKDVAERGMDEEVHGFVNEAIPPINVRKRNEEAYAPNGVSNQYPNDNPPEEE